MTICIKLMKIRSNTRSCRKVNNCSLAKFSDIATIQSPLQEKLFLKKVFVIKVEN